MKDYNAIKNAFQQVEKLTTNSEKATAKDLTGILRLVANTFKKHGDNEVSTLSKIMDVKNTLGNNFNNQSAKGATKIIAQILKADSALANELAA